MDPAARTKSFFSCHALSLEPPFRGSIVAFCHRGRGPCRGALLGAHAKLRRNQPRYLAYLSTEIAERLPKYNAFLLVRIALAVAALPVEQALYDGICRHVLRHANVLRSYELEAFLPLIAQAPFAQRDDTVQRVGSVLKKKWHRWSRYGDRRRILRAGLWALLADLLAPAAAAQWLHFLRDSPLVNVLSKRSLNLLRTD